MLLAGRIASSQMRCLPLTEVSDFAATAAMSKLCFVLVHKSPKTPRHGVSFFRRILTRFSSYLRTQRHTEAYRGDKCRSGTIVTMFLTPVVLSSLPSLSSPFYLSHNHIYIFIITFLIVEFFLICSNVHKCPTTQICLNSITFLSFCIKPHTGRVWRSQGRLFSVLGFKIDKSKIRKFSE